MNPNFTTFIVAPNGSDDAPGTLEAPLASLEQALVQARARGGDATICFRAGSYSFDKTVVIDHEAKPDPAMRLTITAWQEEDVLLSAGRRIEGWEQTELADGAIWKAVLPWAQGDSAFRALYAGERLLPRARSHQELAAGYQTTSEPQGKFPTDFCTTYAARTQLHFPEGSFRAWDNLADLEIYMAPQRPWLVNYLAVDQIDFDNRIATVKAQGTYELRGRFVLENHLDFLTEPGEWALESATGTLYYRPEGTEPSSEIVAPTLHEIIRVEGWNDLGGSADEPVENVHIRGLRFSHCDRELLTPEDKGLQHDWAMWDKEGGLVRFRGARHCSLSNCRLEHSAGHGVRLDLYCQDIEIKGNTIAHVGGMGVVMAGYGPGHKDVHKGNRVISNTIFDTGVFYDHSMGIYLWQSGDNQIAHNHIYELGYMGIVLSGVRRRFWDPEMRPRDIREYHGLIDYDATAHLEGGQGAWDDYEPYMHCRNNVVEYNEIHDCMKRLSDGNTIYLSATGPGNIIRANLAYSHSKNFLMRTDDDQFDSLWEKNILIGSADNPRGFTHKGRNAFDNNLLVNCVLGVYTGVHGPSEGINSIRGNIVYWTTAIAGPLLLDSSGFAPGAVDGNLYFSADPVGLGTFLAERRAQNSDENAVIADPCFRDIKRLDFSWDDRAPQLRLGIERIDAGRIGLLDDPAIARIRREGGLPISGTDSVTEVFVG